MINHIRDINKIKNKYGYESSYEYELISLYEVYQKVELNELKDGIYWIIAKNRKNFYKLINFLKRKHYNIQFLKNINNQFFCKIYKN